MWTIVYVRNYEDDVLFWEVDDCMRTSDHASVPLCIRQLNANVPNCQRCVPHSFAGRADTVEPRVTKWSDVRSPARERKTFQKGRGRKKHALSTDTHMREKHLVVPFGMAGWLTRRAIKIPFRQRMERRVS